MRIGWQPAFRRGRFTSTPTVPAAFELPFGGFKKSGYGREKDLEALDAYTQTKTVVVKL